MTQILPFLPWNKCPLSDDAEDACHELTGTLIAADDNLDRIIELLYDCQSFTPRQAEIIDTLNTKIMAFQLKASVLLTQMRASQSTTGEI